jgi:hypothetical protein
VLEKVKDRAFLARQAQWYFLSAGRKDPALGVKPLPALIERNAPAMFTMQMAPTVHQAKDGLLRFRSSEDVSDRQVEVKFNGKPLESAPFQAKPIDHPYDAWLGESVQYLCFAVPRNAVKTGANQIDFVLSEDNSVKLDYLDLTLPV